jgi:hypothetical protein
MNLLLEIIHLTSKYAIKDAKLLQLLAQAFTTFAEETMMALFMYWTEHWHTLIKEKMCFLGLPPGEPAIKIGLSPMEKTPTGFQLRDVLSLCLLIGSSGTGKSSVIIVAAMQLLKIYRNSIALLAFDFEKDDLRQLAIYAHEKLNIDVDVFDSPEVFKINILQIPEGMTVLAFLTILVTLLSENVSLTSAGRAQLFLAEIVIKTYRRFDIVGDDLNVFPTVKNDRWPTIFDLFRTGEEERVPNDPESRRAKHVTNAKIYGMINASGGRGGIFACRTGITPKSLQKYHAIFILKGLQKFVKKFVTELMLRLTYYTLALNPQNQQQIRVYTVMDDSVDFCLEKYPKDDNTDSFTDIVLTGRALGMGWLIAVQDLTGINPILLNEAATKILLRCQNAEVFRKVCAILNIPEEHWELVFSAVHGRMAVVKTQNDPEPFMVNLIKPDEFIGEINNG